MIQTEIYEITRNVPFPGKAAYNVWDYLLEIWGLEVHILRQRNEQEKGKRLISVIDKYTRSTPLTDEYVGRFWCWKFLYQ